MSEIGENKKTAIILFNLGGPDKLENVAPFLYNLFSDKWIIRLPYIFRKILAFIISTFRTNSAKENYKLMGGRSPLLEETLRQKEKLEEKLGKELKDFRIFISMRYWHPFAKDVAKEIKNYDPESIVFLPLYPQNSSSTTISSFEDMEYYLKKYQVNSTIKKIGCYFDEDNFIKAHISNIKEIIEKLDDTKNTRILFSAHSIPVKFIEDGDPYEWQINKTYNAIIKDEIISKYDSKICYQSKVGLRKWLEPSTEEEIKKAAEEKINLVVVPIAFVSEHIETLVELDIEYKKIANDAGIKYVRVPSITINENFMNSLANMVLFSLNSEDNNNCFRSEKCPENFKYCICKR